MKTMMRSGQTIRTGVSLLLMMCLLITLLPTAAAAETTPGAYGTVTVTTKNVVIRTSPGGTRTGYFAQPGTYPMIGPSIVVDGVTWYNLQTSQTAGYVHGSYATSSYGGAGMPSTDKTYVMILAATDILEGGDAEHPASATPVSVAKDTILQLETGTPYTATVGGTAGQYINLYYTNKVYHTKYTDDFAKGILTTDNLNAYIAEVTWQSDTSSYSRNANAKGDFLTHALQAALNLLEYYSDSVDGFYGDLTKSAVTKFRGDNGLASSENANSNVFAKAFAQATDRLDYIRANPGLGGDTGGTGGSAQPSTITTTVDKLRIRKSYSTSSAYIGMIETKGTVLNYTRTQLNGSVTWYYIRYNGTYGWVMGTYVQESSSTGGGGTTPEITDYGTVTITKKLVAIRTAPNGSRSGYHVNTGDVCTMIGPAVEAGGYTWYNIRTEGGRTGYVRGDCADADFGSAGMPSTEKKYVQFLKDGMTITQGEKPSNSVGSPVTLAKDTVLQLVSGSSFSEGGNSYINVYYDNGVVYHTAYSADLVSGLLTTDGLNKYIINTVWPSGIPTGEVAGKVSVGTLYSNDVYVHAVQAALFELGLYTDKVDGIYGDKTADAVYAYKNNFGVSPKNYVVSAADSVNLFAAGMVALQAKRTGSGTGGDGVSGVGDFGTVNTVKKGSWAEIDGGSKSLFPKGTTVTVMSVNTKQVFRIYRWSGANHADVVTYDTTDTAVLCSILGVTYDSDKPNATELAAIKASGDQDWPDNTWPKFRWGGVTLASAYKIPVWVNLNGTVYCASIYVIPHGYNGTSSFSRSTRNGEYYFDLNNMYGMMCVHFYGSTTHSSGVVDPTHMSNINYAYNNAASYFGASKVK